MANAEYRSLIPCSSWCLIAGVVTLGGVTVAAPAIEPDWAVPLAGAVVFSWSAVRFGSLAVDASRRWLPVLAHMYALLALMTAVLVTIGIIQSLETLVNWPGWRTVIP